MNRNDLLTLTAIDYTENALGVAKVDGFVVFVNGLMVGESAIVRIEKVTVHHAFGSVMELITTSPDRVTPRCPIANQCGGCQLQHMSASHQLAFKKAHVQSLFKRHLDLEIDPIIHGMEDPWFYRNKSQVPFEVTKRSLTYGFYRPRSHDILPFETCFIQSDESNRILRFIADFYEGKAIQPTGLKTVLIKKARSTGELMVVLISAKPKLPNQGNLVESLLSTFPTIKSIILNVNPRTDNVILGDEYIPLTPQTTITDELNGLRFEISAPSFYQVNPIQAEVLYESALRLAKLTKKDTVLDLFCGIGTIALSAAQKVKSVIGVEIVEAAIEDAQRNAQLNGISNVRWIVGDAGQAVQTLMEEGLPIDAVIVDPPRKGLDPLSKQALLTLLPKKIIYVSCDPGTLVRDLKELSEAYTIKAVELTDMFPQTVHVETCCLLVIK
jgi:23S rRNA (uracil1939-C5)-methyltransferase